MSMPTDIKLYREGVVALSKIALTQGGSGAKAAAQVLLSTYNGQNYQLDCVDLGSLDAPNREHAKNVLFGRVDTFTEPHSLLENGDEVFEDLQERWSALSVENRYAPHYDPHYA